MRKLSQSQKEGIYSILKELKYDIKIFYRALHFVIIGGLSF